MRGADSSGATQKRDMVMQRGFSVCVAFVLICASTFAQDLGQVKRQLQSYFKSRLVEIERPYREADVSFDREGKPIGKATPVSFCDYPRMEVTGFRLTPDELRIDVMRWDAQVLTLTGGVPDRTRSQMISLHIRSGGQPWTAENALEAVKNVFRGGPKHEVPLPRGARLPPEGSDSRIVYMIGDAPVYRFGDQISPPRARKGDDPDYTQKARKAGTSGIVGLRLVVNEDGRPSNVIVVRPLGQGLDESAVQTVEHWRFSPATLKGKPVKVDIHVDVRFCLYQP